MSKKWFRQKSCIDMDSAGSVSSAESKGKPTQRLVTESTERPPQLGSPPCSSATLLVLQQTRFPPSLDALARTPLALTLGVTLWSPESHPFSTAEKQAEHQV